MLSLILILSIIILHGLSHKKTRDAVATLGRIFEIHKHIFKHVLFWYIKVSMSKILDYR